MSRSGRYPPIKQRADWVLHRAQPSGTYFVTVRALPAGKVLGFNFTSTGASAQDLVSEATVTGFDGATYIRAIDLQVSDGHGYLGFGKTATKTPGEDIIPIWEGTYFSRDDLDYASISIIRSGATNITAKGHVVVK